jgi:predicted nuclease with TOPRIM domain
MLGFKMNDLIYFLLGGAVVFVGGLIYSQIKTYFDEKTAEKRRVNDEVFDLRKRMNNLEDGLKSFKSTASYVLDQDKKRFENFEQRIEKLENRKK